MVKIKLLNGPSTGEHSPLLLQNSLHRTMEKVGWLHISNLRKKMKDSQLLFSRKYYGGRVGAVNLAVKVNKAFMIWSKRIGRLNKEDVFQHFESVTHHQVNNSVLKSQVQLHLGSQNQCQELLYGQLWSQFLSSIKISFFDFSFQCYMRNCLLYAI